MIIVNWPVYMQIVYAHKYHKRNDFFSQLIPIYIADWNEICVELCCMFGSKLMTTTTMMMVLSVCAYDLNRNKLFG